MNRDDIIRMAREAGMNVVDDQYSLLPFFERFAALVAAHIRETEFKPDWNNYRQGFADGAAEEREACAKTAEDFLTRGRSPLGRAVGEAIRARGQA